MDHKANWMSYVLTLVLGVVGFLYVEGQQAKEQVYDERHNLHEKRIDKNSESIEKNHNDIVNLFVLASKLPTKEDFNAFEERISKKIDRNR